MAILFCLCAGGDVNEGAILFCQVGANFQTRGGFFAGNVVYFTKGATFPGGMLFCDTGIERTAQHLASQLL